MEHEIAVVIWNEFISKTINKGCNFSFNDLEKRIKETITKALRQHDVSSQRELLLAFLESISVSHPKTNEFVVDNFLYEMESK